MITENALISQLNRAEAESRTVQHRNRTRLPRLFEAKFSRLSRAVTITATGELINHGRHWWRVMNTRDDEHAATALDELKRRVRAAKRAFMPRNQASKSKRRRDTTPLASPRLITVNSTRLINGNFNVSPLLEMPIRWKSGGLKERFLFRIL